MTYRYYQCIRSRQLLNLLRDNEESRHENQNHSITKNVKEGQSGSTQNINCSPHNRQQFDSYERVLLERQNTMKINLKHPKSLSLNDLTQDSQIIFIKRSLSAPQAQYILDLGNEILDRSSCISPSIAAGFYDIDTDCTNDPDYRNSTTDCESSEDEYGNVNEGRKRRHIARKEEWKKLKAQKQRMRGEEYLGYSKPRNEKMRQDRTRSAKQLGEACTSQYCKKSKFRGCDSFEEETRRSLHS